MDKKDKKLSVAFLPGDDLYYVDTGDRNGAGPGLFQIKCQKNGIRSIQVDTDGTERIVDEEGGTPEPPGGQWTCLDQAAALSWAKDNLPGALWLEDFPVTAVYSGPGGIRKPITFGGTLSELEELVCAKPAAMEPDENGIMAVYDAGATKETSPYSTFLNDSAGRPVDVIYGAYVLVAVKPDPATGFLRLADMPKALLDAMDRKPAGQDCRYDPACWVQASRMTVAMLREYLSKLPDAAVLHCCGTDLAYLHYCPATGSLSVDCEDLSDLPEYDGHEPALLKGPEA